MGISYDEHGNIRAFRDLEAHWSALRKGDLPKENYEIIRMMKQICRTIESLNEIDRSLYKLVVKDLRDKYNNLWSIAQARKILNIPDLRSR